jgi:hypothetical protein
VCFGKLEAILTDASAAEGARDEPNWPQLYEEYVARFES